MLPFFDWFFPPRPIIKPPKIRLPQLGYTVSQSEYDIVYKWFEEKRDELNQISMILAPYERKAGAVDPASERDGPVQLAITVRDLLIFDREIIERLTREQEQLIEQFGEANAVKLETQLKEANEMIEVWQDRAHHIDEQLEIERRTYRDREAYLLSQLTDARTALEVAKARANKKKIPDMHQAEEVK